MGHYLRNIITPLGTVPLLKDTTWDGFFSPLELLNTCAVYLNDQTLKTSDQLGFYAGLLFGSGPAKSFREWPIEGRQSIDFPASRHYVVRDDAAGDYLVFDAGKPCPDYLPAHAHADSLSYELSVANQRIIVDSGVYEYTAGPWRDYFRSTRAHTTVEVEHENQSEVWSSFRVGSRARPGPSYWQSEDNLVLMQGEHDGYRRLVVPVIHQRTILAAPQRLWLVADQLWGNGQTNLASHVHFHPDLILEQVGDSVWQIQNSREPLWLTAFGDTSASIAKGQLDPVRQGWYSERFGELIPNTVLTFREERASLPYAFGYVIGREIPVQISCVAISRGHLISLESSHRRFRLQLVRDQSPVVT